MELDFAKFDACAERLIQAGERVGERLQAEFELLRAMYDPEALSPRLGFARTALTPGAPLLAEDGSRWPAAPVKYAIEARRSVEMWREFLPFLGGIEAAFEIGVGPGYLFRLMMDLYGTQMTGCDVEINELAVYDAIRSELGIRHLVQEHFVAKRVSTPVTPGAEAVLAFALVFDKGFDASGARWLWSVEDHEWFLHDLASQTRGRRRLICRFNKRWLKNDNRDVVLFYRRVGIQPLRTDKRFFIVDLNPFV
jgi:hypothetical protein